MDKLNSKEKLCCDMVSVLKYIDSERKLPELDQDGMFALKQCVDDDYVTGVVTETMISGRIVAEYNSPRVTKKGLEFLYPSNSFEKCNNEAKPIRGNNADSKHQKKKCTWGTVGAIVGALTFAWMILEHYGIV